MVSSPGHRIRRRSLPCATAGHFPDTHDGARVRDPGTPAGATRTPTTAATGARGTPGAPPDR
jgi:hypothetical protein